MDHLINFKKQIYELTDTEDDEKLKHLTPEQVKKELYDEKGIPIFENVR